MTLEVIEPGLHTTIQDHGRSGYQHLGFAPSGMLDTDSFRIANWIVGNEDYEAAIEMMGLGGVFVFTHPTQIALTGADCNPTLNGKAIHLYRNYSIKKGDKLTCGALINGMVSILAVQGGFQVDKVMESSSTHTKIQIGGDQGRKLQANDTVSYLPINKEEITRRSIKKEKVYPKKEVIRIVLGPQSQDFPQESIKKFFHSTYTLSSQSDRMGYRLEGEPIKSKKEGNMLSEGTVLGALQVPSDGQPIVLMNDRQTTGGYPVIGVVSTVDLPALAQKSPGSKVQFRPIRLEEAQQHLKEKEKRFTYIKEYLKEMQGNKVPLEEGNIGEFIQLFNASGLKQFYYKDTTTKLRLEKGEENLDNH